MPLREIAFVFSSTWLCFIGTLYQSGVLVVTHSLLKIGFPGPWVWVFLLHQVFSLFSTTALLMLFFTQQSLYSKLFFQECFSTMWDSRVFFQECIPTISLLKTVFPILFLNNLTLDCFSKSVFQTSLLECFSKSVFQQSLLENECFSKSVFQQSLLENECFSKSVFQQSLPENECFSKRFFQQSVLKNVVPRVFFSNLYSGMFFPNSVFAIMWHACHFRWRSVSKD
jgi:hypothetical protein